MAFTIAAAGLLLGTLKATQQMAFDTKRIGVAQTRAFIVVTPNFARQYYDDFQVSFGVSNGGMTGAFNARLRCTIAIYFDGREVTSSSGWKNLGMLEGGRRMEKIEILFPFEAMSIPATLTDDKRYHAIIDAFVVYSDVFKIKHTNHLKVGLFPKIGSGEGKIILKNEEQSEPRDDWLG